MKASVCFVFAVVCWFTEQAESPKIHQGMDKNTSLNSPTINDLKGTSLYDPCWILEEYINFAQWVDGSLFIMQPNPEPSQPSLHNTETKPEPTPAIMHKPETEKWTEPSIAPEPEPHCESDQVCEPVLTSVPVVVLVKLNTDDWLTDWGKEVAFPTLPTTIASSPQPFARGPALPPHLDFYVARMHLLGGGVYCNKHALYWFHFQCTQFLFCLPYAQHTLYSFGLSQMKDDQCETVTVISVVVAPKRWSCYVIL